MSLEIRELYVAASRNLTLGPLSATVDEGRTLVLLGTDAGAVSLLAAAIGTGLGIESGSVGFDDDTVFPGKAKRPPVAFVPARLPPTPRASLEEMLAGVLKTHGVPREEWPRRVAAALAGADLERHGARRMGDLTDAVLMRSALAAALVWGPGVLVCDTLTAVLPERRRGELRDVLGTVARAHGLPVVIATSEPREALSLADEVAVLHGGRVVQVAAPLLLYRRPANRTVAELLGGGNFLHARVLRCAGGFALVDTAAGPFRAALPEGFEPAVGHDATLLIRPESLHVERMPADENSLEGRIARVEYAGAEARYTFRSGDVTLQIRELNPRFTSPPPADLWVWADAEDVVVLPG